MNKSNLDEIIEKYKAQPVGHGYIDILVSRDNYKDFVVDIVKNGFKIESISWWEWCFADRECKYGLGGPESIFYKGWFSELSISIDNLKLSDYMNKKEKIKEIINLIETKVISFQNEKVTFKTNNWLTPAIWLDVPKEWRNKYSI